MSSKVFLIGLDGATWELIEPWIEAGELPTLAQLAETGTTGTLQSTIPSKTPVALPALYTGTGPTRTGSFGFRNPDGSPHTLRDIEGPKIWNVLESHGLSSCIINVRTTYPPEPLDGIMISGSPLPDEDTRYTYPSELQEETDFQPEVTTDESRFHDAPYQKAEEMMGAFEEGFESRLSTFQSLANEREFDLNMFWIGRTDSLQHWLWDDTDSLLTFYKMVDERLGELLDGVEGDVFIVSDHGFESAAGRRFHVNEWLRRNDFLSIVGGRIGNYCLSTGQQLARSYIDGATLKKILSYIPDGENDESNGSEDVIDRSFASIPGIGSDSKAILATPWGIDVLVEGEERQRTQEVIISRLGEVTDHDGTEVVKDAWRKEDVYPDGPYFDEIPDVIFQLNENYFAAGQLSASLFSPLSGKIGTAESGYRFNGDHVYARDGVFLAAGPNIDEQDKIDLHISDVAPTILHLLDLPIPTEMTGTVDQSLFEDGAVPASRDVRREDFDSDLRSSETSREEKREMLSHLEDMGYI